MPLLPSVPEQTALGPALRRFPIADNALLAYRSALMFPGEPLGLAECELVATYVSALNRCDYCVGSHRVVAEAQGIDPSLLTALVDDPGKTPSDPATAALLALVARSTLAPADVRAEDSAAARAAGWTEVEIAHAVSVCAFFNGMNRIAEGIGVDSTPPDVADTVARVAKRPEKSIDAASALLRHHHGLMRGASPLSVAERELLAGYVSALNRCESGLQAHRGAAEANGLPPGVFAALCADPLDGLETVLPDERLAPLANFVRILTVTPGRVGAADAQSVFAAGWSEEALFHAISVCALANLLNRLIECPGVPPDPRIGALYEPAQPNREAVG